MLCCIQIEKITEMVVHVYNCNKHTSEIISCVISIQFSALELAIIITHSLHSWRYSVHVGMTQVLIGNEIKMLCPNIYLHQAS